MNCDPASSPSPSPAESEDRSSSGDQSIMAPVAEFGTALIALANRAMDSVSGRSPMKIQHEEALILVSGDAAVTLPSTVTATGSSDDDGADANCTGHCKAFQDCLNSSEFDDMGKCQYYMDMLAGCCRNSTL